MLTVNVQEPLTTRWAQQVDILACDAQGRGPLAIAAAHPRRQAQVLHTLLERGAHPASLDTHAQNAWHAAALVHNQPALDALYARVGDLGLHAVDAQGRNALHLALGWSEEEGAIDWFGNLNDTLRWLGAHDLDWNHADAAGHTPIDAWLHRRAHISVAGMAMHPDVGTLPWHPGTVVWPAQAWVALGAQTVDQTTQVRQHGGSDAHHLVNGVLKNWAALWTALLDDGLPVHVYTPQEQAIYDHLADGWRCVEGPLGACWAALAHAQAIDEVRPAPGALSRARPRL